MCAAVTVEAAPFAGRYRVERTLGEGGIGMVELVTDLRNGRQLALKRLLPGRDGKSRDAVTLLFQREYHVLAQLSHPNIIEALDYGVADGEPYYMMELLDGSDLRQLAPMAWQPACEILLDVCSALALLHSRGLVHRDLTPANVRRTSDGRTKLIDFGAMCPMGEAADLVGTPPYMAPELVHGQVLDGRADLYALGAVGYWLLTGQHAFPARRISQLRDLWRSLPARISTRQADVPPVLEQLIMSLLSLDPLARPRSSTEVVQRLSALVGREPHVPLSAAQAYLTTPMLVGRTQEQIQFRKHALTAKAGQGAHVLVRAAAGLGRSRLLDAFALEGKLAGMLVARVRVNGLSDEDHSAVASVVRSIQQALPEEVTWSDREQAAFSSLPATPSQPPRAVNPAAEPTDALYDTLDQWLLGIARRHGLLLLLDDTHLYDAASLMVFARWLRRAPFEKLLVISSADSDTQARHVKPHQLLTERSTQMGLHALSNEDNLKLLASLFGDVAHLRPVAEWIYRVATGNPRRTMDLAQHLVDRGVARFGEGAWHFPETLEALSLPADFQEAIDQRIAQLPAMARALAQGLSMDNAYAPIELHEYIQLLDGKADAMQLFAALDALFAAQILVRAGERYVFRQQTMADALRRTLSKDEERALHLRIAAIYEHVSRQLPAVSAWHRYFAGELEAAYRTVREILSAPADDDRVRILNERIGRSAQAIELFQRCHDYAVEHDLGERDLYLFRRALVGLGATLDPALARYADDLLPQLLRQTGLSRWDDLPASLDASARAQLCLQTAIEDYEKTPEAERWLHPLQAVEDLSQATVMLTSSYSSTWDAARLVKLSEIMNRFRTLSPALAFQGEVFDLTLAGIVRGGWVGEQRRVCFEQLRTPIPGMNETVQHGMISIFHFYVGLDDSSFDAPRALEHAAALEKEPFYTGLAAVVRMFYFLNRGDYRAAEEARVQMELHALRDLANDQHFTAGLIFEAGTLTRFGDLLGFKRILPAFEACGALHPGWRPWTLFVRAHYALCRGEIDKAAAIVAEAEPYMEPCRHGAWQQLHLLQMRVLIDQGEPHEALAVGDRLAAALATHNVAATDMWSYGNHSYLAMARAGRAEEAARQDDQQILFAEQAGLAPMLLASCYETRARIAMCMRDVAAFRDYSARIDTLLRPGGHPAAMAFFDRLMSDARKLEGFLESTEIFEQRELGLQRQDVRTMVTARLLGNEDPKARAQAALSMLIEESNAEGGYLFVFASGGHLAHVASIREGLPAEAIKPEIERYLSQTLTSGETDIGETLTNPESVTESMAAEMTHSFSDPRGLQYVPLLLRSYEGNHTFAVGVVVLCAKQSEKVTAPWMLLSALAHALLEAGDAHKTSYVGLP